MKPATVRAKDGIYAAVAILQMAGQAHAGGRSLAALLTQFDETTDAFHAFTLYRDMTADERSLQRVADVHFEGRVGKRVQMERWSSKNRWRFRVAAWDDEQDRIRRKAHLDEVKRMSERHAQIAAAVQDALAPRGVIVAIEPRDMISVVEPGVRNLDLKKAAQEYGLFYPPDPASNDACSVGGNAATNAGGPTCVKYGTTRDYILGLEAVLPNGKLIRTGVQTRKGVVGYDMTRLLVGSEGTLGIITKLIVRLIPLPADVCTLVALFPKLTSAMETITTILMRGHMPSTLEFRVQPCINYHLSQSRPYYPFSKGKYIGIVMFPGCFCGKAVSA